MNKDLINAINEIANRAPQLFLDYDGTLVPIINDPDKAMPDSEILEILADLDSQYELFIVTGRALDDIIKFLGHMNIIALHGAIFYIDSCCIPVYNFETYIKKCDEIFARNSEYIKKYPDLRVYNKNGGVLFHLGNVKDKNIRINIEEMVTGLAVESGMELYRGIEILEIRIPGINKGEAIRAVRNKNRAAFIIGDDATDEEAFKLNMDAVTVKVGENPTYASYNVKFKNVKKILRSFIKNNK
ncbi:MAG: trehalose-phosphatase [Ferroplasma sp.]